MRTVCLKHVPIEGPGTFTTALTARGVSLERYLIPQDGLPKDAGDLLILMSGLRRRGRSVNGGCRGRSMLDEVLSLSRLGSNPSRPRINTWTS